MKGKILFSVVALMAVAAILVLFGIATETWDGACSHKQEYGFFPFYRAVSDYSPAFECAMGILLGGLAKTITAVVAIVTVVYFSWRNFIGKGS